MGQNKGKSILFVGKTDILRLEYIFWGWQSQGGWEKIHFIGKLNTKPTAKVSLSDDEEKPCPLVILSGLSY